MTLNDAVVTTIHGKAVTRGELNTAFKKVADKTNWKFPVSATVKIANDFEMAVIGEAIIFFTGSEATFTAKGKNTYVVEAAGYYVAVGP